LKKNLLDLVGAGAFGGGVPEWQSFTIP